MKNSSNQIITMCVSAQKNALISYCKEKQYKIYDIYPDLGKIATRDIAISLHPQGFKGTMKVTKKVAKLLMRQENLMKNQLKNQPYQIKIL